MNLLLKRLPWLLDRGVSPEAAFGGTFHINETWTQLDDAYAAAEQGTVPDPLPCEMRAELQAAVVKCSVLAEPIEELLLTGTDGTPCIETKTTLDIQRAVGMPRGNVFHGGLDRPFAEEAVRRGGCGPRSLLSGVTGTVRG